VQLDLRCWKLVVGGLEDWADRDPKTDPRPHAVGSEQPSGVGQALESVIVMRLEDSTREEQLVKKSVLP
jgi:hypothetical protein